MMAGERDAAGLEAMRSPGWEMPILLMGAFRHLIDELHVDLAARGFPDARPGHGFALQAVGPHGVTVTELGRRLGVSKQAAAKTAVAMERLGYLTREPSPEDARAILLRRSDRGEAVLMASAEFFARQQAHWVAVIGLERFMALVNDLRILAGEATIGDTSGWLGLA